MVRDRGSFEEVDEVVGYSAGVDRGDAGVDTRGQGAPATDEGQEGVVVDDTATLDRADEADDDRSDSGNS